MLAQATLLVIGGSDTTSLFFTAMTYFLLDKPETLRLLTEEVRSAFRSVDEIDHNATLNLQYLNAVIEEGLRLLPSIPLGLTRVSPGAVVDGKHIPKGVCNIILTQILLLYILINIFRRSSQRLIGQPRTRRNISRTPTPFILSAGFQNLTHSIIPDSSTIIETRRGHSLWVQGPALV